MNEATASHDDNRKHPRMKTDWSSRLITREKAEACRVLNLSACGAMLASDAPHATDQPVMLEMEYLGGFTGQVVWCHPGLLGIRFDRSHPDAASFAGSWRFYEQS